MLAIELRWTSLYSVTPREWTLPNFGTPVDLSEAEYITVSWGNSQI
jgi:hypothetical protein